MGVLRWLFGAGRDAGGRGKPRPALVPPRISEPVLTRNLSTAPTPLPDDTKNIRLAALRDWQAELARLGGVAPKPVTRGDLTAVLRARGWDRIIQDGETLFLRNDDRGAASISFQLKTFPGTALNAPDQRLTMSCFLSPHDYLAVASALASPHEPPPLVHRITVKRQGFVLTRADLDSAASEAEAKLAGTDFAMYLDQAAGWAPSRPGSAGLVHLAALVLRGDQARLDQYAAQGAAAGFVPFITPDMLRRAAQLGRDRPPVA